jgi:hypothetical protein
MSVEKKENGLKAIVSYISLGVEGAFHLLLEKMGH